MSNWCTLPHRGGSWVTTMFSGSGAESDGKGIVGRRMDTRISSDGLTLVDDAESCLIIQRPSRSEGKVLFDLFSKSA